MTTEAKRIDTLYTKLVKEYNTNGWYTNTSLERFLIIKREAAAKANDGYLFNDICDVINLANNDY